MDFIKAAKRYLFSHPASWRGLQEETWEGNGSRNLRFPRAFWNSYRWREIKSAGTPFSSSCTPQMNGTRAPVSVQRQREVWAAVFCMTLCLGAWVPFRDGRQEQKEPIQHGLSVGNVHLFDMRVLYFMLPVTSLAELCAAFSHRLSIMTGNPILKVTE